MRPFHFRLIAMAVPDRCVFRHVWPYFWQSGPRPKSQEAHVGFVVGDVAVDFIHTNRCTPDQSEQLHVCWTLLRINFELDVTII
jgi:hypothetical protein